MKYRAVIYIQFERGHHPLHITTIEADKKEMANAFLLWIPIAIEQATGGHIEQFVDGIGWVVCEEEGDE